MEFIDEQLSEYCEAHTEQESELLKELNRETHLKVMSPRMLSGHLQGRFLSLLSRMKQPDFIIEIGTYTGYSALCLAEGLKELGRLITIDPNEETNAIAKKYFDRSPYRDKIEIVHEGAAEALPKISVQADLVFIDADKKNYALYFDLVIDKVKPGGLIIADNVLWSGKITMPEKEMDKETAAIDFFNKKIQADGRVRNILLPVRDGLMVMEKA